MQFVYAAGHDLQEPLRSISSFTELLKRQCPGDRQAAELTSYIIDSVKRMNTLVQDVLAYARAGTSPKRTAVSLNAVAQWAMLNLDKPIRESGAKVACGPLPEVLVDESEFVQLFQHLLSNALRYHGSEAPEIEVSATSDEETCVISVRDNGAGIEREISRSDLRAFQTPSSKGSLRFWHRPRALSQSCGGTRRQDLGRERWAARITLQVHGAVRLSAVRLKL